MTNPLNENYSLQDKVAIVTGGGKGLGRTITEYLLNQGMKVAICSRTESTITATVNELSKSFPGKIIGSVCDVADSAQVSEFTSMVQQQFGTVHVLVNNSGFGKDTLVWKTSEADWDSVMDTNVKGAFLMSKALLPAMVEGREGYIINIASQAALNGYANAGVYCASKFAMLGLGKALQEEVREFDIHVHTLNPALIQSQKTDQEAVNNSLIQNQDLASMIVYLLSQPRRLKIDNIGMWGFK
ncbi:SDR family oxidoreductase [Thalassotalea sp. PS06]|nr:SDR family oxidoreductase [Thalassotalea sp. PS06]QDP02836.1 SDR family oxidoreductase [Thalassotalea sp. PS06]